jgi:hypothetical protein
MSVLYESFVNEQTSTRVNLALRPRTEGSLHSQDSLEALWLKTMRHMHRHQPRCSAENAKLLARI